MMTRLLVGVLMVLAVSVAGIRGRQSHEPSPELEALHHDLDALLDLYVRDGLVYYQALKADRGRLSRYIASLSSPALESSYPSWDRDRQKAFWINAYNAFVMQTVVDRYPILGRASGYPANSIRQIVGAFDARVHRAAGRSASLDEIENDILAQFKDPRVSLVLGRGAVSSGRLRSEAFGGRLIERQLEQSRAQFATSPRYAKVDALAGRVGISPILSWRAEAFIAQYAGESFEMPGREPIERAVVGFLRPHLLTAEEAFIKKNTFQLAYEPFDWRLNDLTGGRADH